VDAVTEQLDAAVEAGDLNAECRHGVDDTLDLFLRHRGELALQALLQLLKARLLACDCGFEFTAALLQLLLLLRACDDALAASRAHHDALAGRARQRLCGVVQPLQHTLQLRLCDNDGVLGARDPGGGIGDALIVLVRLLHPVRALLDARALQLDVFLVALPVKDGLIVRVWGHGEPDGGLGHQGVDAPLLAAGGAAGFDERGLDLLAQDVHAVDVVADLDLLVVQRLKQPLVVWHALVAQEVDLANE